MKIIGPFGKEGIQYKHIQSKWTGRLLVEESGYKTMQALARCGVLTKTQAVALSGCGRNCRSIFPRLVQKGYLDCYEAAGVPKLYGLSAKGAESMGVMYRIWDTTGLQRLAAANQFWLKIKQIWPEAKWNTTGEFPVLMNKGILFNVIAPRAGHLDRLYALRQLNQCQDRVFIVAANEETALDIALHCPPGRMVRYTWDDRLKERLTVYRLTGKQQFELDEKIAKTG